jgi:hypothetical protein
MKNLRALIAAETAIGSQLDAICDSQTAGAFHGPAFASAKTRIADALTNVEQLIARYPCHLVAAERAHRQAEALRTEAERLLCQLPPPAAAPVASVDQLHADLAALTAARDTALSPHLRRLRRFAGDERDLNTDIRAHAQARADAVNARYAPRIDAVQTAVTEAQLAERAEYFANVARERAAELQAQADALQAAHPARPTRGRGTDRAPRRSQDTRPSLPPDLHKRFTYVPATGELLRTYRRDALVTGPHLYVRGVWYPVLEIVAALISTTDKLTLRNPNEPPALSNLLRSPQP